MFRNAIVLSIIILGAVAMTLVISNNQTSAQDAELGARVYELRTYHCNPGKLDDLHARFRVHTNYLFVRHGMTLIGYWTPADGDTADNTLVYLIAHESRDAARKSWAAFSADPDWKKAAAASEENGSLLTGIESTFLNPTDYSPLR